MLAGAVRLCSQHWATRMRFVCATPVCHPAMCYVLPVFYYLSKALPHIECDVLRPWVLAQLMPTGNHKVAGLAAVVVMIVISQD